MSSPPSTPGGEAPAKRGAESERILDAAEERFIERGFRGTSLRDVAAAAGCTTGAIYWSFGSKDALFLAVFHRRTAEYKEVWRAAFEEASSPWNATAAMGAALRSLRAQPEWYGTVVEFLSHAARDDRIAREAAEIYRSGASMVADALSEVAPRSTLSRERLAAAIAALLRGLTLTWFVDPESTDVELFADTVNILIGITPALEPISPDEPPA